MRVVREAERARITGIPRSTCYLLMKQGKFPKPVPIGERSVAWLESELLEWVEQRVRDRDAEVAR